jgi:hypothetical protein
MIQHCFENVKKILCLIFINKYFFPFRAIMVMIIWWLDLQLPMQPMPITTKIVSFNPAYGKMYSIQVCKFVSGWCFSPGTPASSTNKTDCHDITEILLKVALNTITLTHFGLIFF